VRVAFVAYHASPLLPPGSGDAGGMNVYVRELAGALGARGVAVDIFTRATVPADDVIELEGGVRVVPMDAGPRADVPKEELAAFLPAFVSGIDAFRAGEAGSYDVVHSHYWQSGLAARELAGAWGVPLVHTYHTLARMKNRFLALGDEPESPERLRAEEEVLAGADLITASSAAELDQLGDRAACFLPPGVDLRLFTPGDRRQARRRLGLEGERVVICVGRIQPLKGLELAVRALLHLEQPPLLLVVGGASGRGGEPELDRLGALASALGVADRVRFLGPQPRSLLPLLYRAAHAAIVCSHSESFGFTALEAQACGTPVVGTPVGALPEIVVEGESGFVLGRREPALLADRLRLLLADCGLRRAFAHAATRSAARFTWERTATELLRRYARLAPAPRVIASGCA